MKGVEGSIIESFRVGSKEVAISHLQFVDDTILFCYSKEEFSLSIIQMVDFFESISGLKFNRTKCQIMGIHSDIRKIRRWADTFEGEVGFFP